MNVDTSKVAEHVRAALADTPAAPPDPGTPETPGSPPGPGRAEATIQETKLPPAEPRAEPAPEPAAPEAAPEPEPAAPEPARTQQAEQVFEVVVNGVVEKLPLAQLVALAQQGKDYTQKTQALAEKVRSTQKLLGELQPWIDKAKKIQQEENEAQESDPVLKAQRTAERAAEEARQLREESERRDAASRADAYRVELVRAVESERSKHKAFESVKGIDPALEEWIADKISDDILIGRIHPAEAVARTAKALDALRKLERDSYLRAKVDDAKRSPVPKPGAPAPSKVKSYTAQDLRSGKIAESVAERLRAAGYR